VLRGEYELDLAALRALERWCTVSFASWLPSWPCGAAATKKRVSKRRERPGAVIQWPNQASSPAGM
jgi:hypothetical protein